MNDDSKRNQTSTVTTESGAQPTSDQVSGTKISRENLATFLETGSLTATSQAATTANSSHPSGAGGTAGAPPTPPQNPLPRLTEDESREVLKRAFDEALRATPEEIEIAKITTNPLHRIIGRRYADRDGGPTDEVRTQVDAVGLLNPIIVLRRETSKHGEQYFLLTGAKRLRAMEKAQESLQLFNVTPKIWCRRIEFTSLFSQNEIATWGEGKIEVALAEVSKSLVYTESALNTPLSDMALFDLLSQIRMDHDFAKRDFDRVMGRLGLTRKSKNYRNVKRIWDVVCCPAALDLIGKKMAKLKLFKKDQNLRPMEQAYKAQRISDQIAEHIKMLRENSDDRNRRTCPATSLSNYKDFDIERIIREIDMPNRSATGRLQDDYRQPRFKVRMDDKRLSLPATKIDFTDLDPNNVRTIVETLFHLKSITDQLQRFVQSISPTEPGGEVIKMKFKPAKPEYGERYCRFLQDYRLEGYANIQRVAQHLKRQKKDLVPAAALAAQPLPEQSRLLIEAFIKKSKQDWLDRTSQQRKIEAEVDEKIRAMAEDMDWRGSDDPRQTSLLDPGYHTLEDEVKGRFSTIRKYEEAVADILEEYGKRLADAEAAVQFLTIGSAANPDAGLNPPVSSPSGPDAAKDVSAGGAKDDPV